ncbi:MAG: hypothetical protein JWQ44_1243 [Chthoniobacter sp.]|nr:hypothetical protein [Chthoniobacter sp.]
MPRFSRLEFLVFFATFFAFAYFNQGGGWNQNARFAEVRAMAEEGRFAIDNFLVYRPQPGSPILQRIPVQNAEYSLNGKIHRLAWVDMEWNFFPVNEKPAEPGVTNAPMVELCASGDIGYVPWTGKFHPNKPPGTAFLALPGYWLVYQIERLCGISPDHWWVVGVNAWLASVLSVGLLSALACVLFFRLAREFSPTDPTAPVLATLTFAFGTMFLPYGTLLFDHNLTAAALLATFYFIRKETTGALVLAGVCAGFGAVTNYIAAVVVIFFGIYLLLRRRSEGAPLPWRNALLYSLGVLGPFLLICWYGWVCFGSPFRLNTDFQNPLFKDPNGALGMFKMPSLYVASLISISPFRGLFFLAPVLVAGIYGIVIWLRERTFVAEARLCLAIFGFFFLVNASFNGYHGGFSVGPRYLVPALPFLALPLVVAFIRWRKITCALAVVSVFNQLILTATDAQNPLAVGGLARIETREDGTYNLVGDYAWPLFAHERAWPILEMLLNHNLAKEADQLAAQGLPEGEAERTLQALERDLRESIERGEASPFLLASIRGPVSVNPIGVYEGMFHQLFSPGSEQTSNASVNLGEFLWPQSRWSLLPLLLVSGSASALLLRLARRLSAQKVAAP